MLHLKKSTSETGSEVLFLGALRGENNPSVTGRRKMSEAVIISANLLGAEKKSVRLKKSQKYECLCAHLVEGDFIQHVAAHILDRDHRAAAKSHIAM